MTQLTTKKDKTDNTTLENKKGLPGQVTKPSTYKKIRQKMKKTKEPKVISSEAAIQRCSLEKVF